jgi:hypothetical protein
VERSKDGEAPAARLTLYGAARTCALDISVEKNGGLKNEMMSLEHVFFKIMKEGNKVEKNSRKRRRT